jgi:hypothetical protein
LSVLIICSGERGGDGGAIANLDAAGLVRLSPVTPRGCGLALLSDWD